jgi:hypothetical protein
MRGKKAMMDDLFDLMFTIVVAFFALLFLSGALNANVDNSNEIALNAFDEYLAEQRFLTFLESPATIQGKQGNVAELIVWSVNHDDFEGIEQQALQLLEEGKNRFILMTFDKDEFMETTQGFTDRQLSSDLRLVSIAKHNFWRREFARDDLDDSLKPHFVDLPNFKGQSPQYIRVLFKYKQGGADE